MDYPSDSQLGPLVLFDSRFGGNSLTSYGMGTKLVNCMTFKSCKKVPCIFAKYMTKCAPMAGVMRYAPDVLILKIVQILLNRHKNILFKC